MRGVGRGAFTMGRPGYLRRQWDELLPMLASGVVDPPLSATYPVEQVARALTHLAERRVLGKTVLTFG